MKITAAITAVEGYAPEYVLSNKELEGMVETTDEWIISRTGIEERRILKGEGKGTSDMAAVAIKNLLAKRTLTQRKSILLFALPLHRTLFFLLRQILFAIRSAPLMLSATI